MHNSFIHTSVMFHSRHCRCDTISVLSQPSLMFWGSIGFYKIKQHVRTSFTNYFIILNTIIKYLFKMCQCELTEMLLYAYHSIRARFFQLSEPT